MSSSAKPFPPSGSAYKQGDASSATANTAYYWIIPLVWLIDFVVFYITAQPLLDDSDVPWHLAAGKFILSTHRIPTTDPWSFASHGQPWYLLSWIWDTILGAIDQWIGPFAVLIFTLSLCASIVAAVAGHMLTLRIDLPPILLTVFLASLCILDFITARPHLAGYGFALAFAIVLHHSRGRTSYGKLLWLPPLMLIWANTHGSFIAGFTVLGTYITEAFITKHYHWLKRLLIISALCGICALINPYGLDVTIGALRTLGGSAKQYTIEWLPFAFSASAGVSTWLLVFIMASNLRGASIAIADKILAFAWLLATMFAMRNGPIFILLSAPYFATCLDEATQGLRKPFQPSGFMLFMARQKLRHVWLAAAAAFAVIVGAISVLPHQDKIISEDMSVSDAIDFAREHYPDTRFLTDFNFGGQVIYRTQGTLPFFMDSRAATAYGEEAMEDYIEFLWLKEDWEEKLAKYKLGGIMISKQSAFAKAYAQGQYHKAWQLVFAGKRANVYIARP